MGGTLTLSGRDWIGSTASRNIYNVIDPDKAVHAVTCCGLFLGHPRER